MMQKQCCLTVERPLWDLQKNQDTNRAKNAIVKALDSPLLNDNKITGAKNVLLLDYFRKSGSDFG